MTRNSQFAILKKLLLRTQNHFRLWAALIALCIGTTLLLVSTLIWWNFNELLYGKNQNDAMGSTYLVIGKKVTDENMGKPQATVFSQVEIADLKTAPQVEEIGVISSNRFPVYAMMGGNLGFSTELPLESVPDNFIDKMPENWKWQPGANDLPIIISSQFLDIYNYVFAPSQNLPQLSESTVKSLSLKLKAGDDKKNEMMMAHVVGFTDRIGSVLVPQSFIDYGNKEFAKNQSTTSLPSQLILKTKDPSDTKFADFLRKHNYTTNSQNLRWSKVRSIVEIVTTATGVLAFLLLGIGCLVFILFIELTIAKAQTAITLLLQIGYSPKFISTYMVKQFLPMVIYTVLASAGITFSIQLAASAGAKAQSLILPQVPGLPVWAALLLSTAILVVLIISAIRKAINRQV